MTGQEPAEGGQRRAPGGLLGKLMAEARPEFRADVLVFDPADPVFGGEPCLVPGCGRPLRSSGMCYGHYRRWAGAGRPDPGAFAVSDGAAAPWSWQAPPGSCTVPGCGSGRRARQLCGSHLGAWRGSGDPDLVQWAAGQPPVSRPDGQETCRIGYCGLWPEPGSVLCFSHGRRWKRDGCPDLGEFIRECGRPQGRWERADLSALAPGLRLEMQYALQCRRDDNMVRTRPTTVRTVIGWVAGSGAGSLLDRSEADWRAASPPGASVHLVAFLAYAHRKVTDLAEGAGWDNEYPRDTWRMRRLGIDSDCATLRFADISQPWLKDLAKRWARWRLGTGLEALTCYHGVRALTRLPGFLDAAGVTALSGITRDVLERYLADLAPEMAGKEAHHHHIGHIATFLRDIRRHQWDTSLPASAQIFPEDYPQQVKRIPRALAAHIMAQVEQPANLERQQNPAYRLITLILIRCGLRITDACKIPADCVVTDADGAPSLRYYNRKMKREALVPMDEELEALIARQQERNRERNPGGTPVLFPRPKANVDGTRPTGSNAYRSALYRWLEDCNIRDEHGQPVRLKPHQWRHTLGTV
ncbi:MAG: tyrosine-type recombinase/integrase, partial [Streptosporangiaceae bacterium]